MNKKTLSLTLGSAIATALLSAAPTIQAGENPFAISSINTSQQLAAADEKMDEGGCSSKMNLKQQFSLWHQSPKMIDLIAP